ncbi:MAG: GNAT family N-acetyltransferase [Halothiobacillus sp.]
MNQTTVEQVRDQTALLSRPTNMERHLQVEFALTPSQIEESFRLRYRVFVDELGAKIDCTTLLGLESDHFDHYCHHVMVRDLNTGHVVACTRILTDTQARVAGGFYSAKEFDLSLILATDGRVMEVGRTCVDPDYRTGATIGTLWSGLAQFMEINRFAHLMGCASIPMNDGGVQAHLIMAHLRAKHLTPESLRINSRRALPPGPLLTCRQNPEIKMPPLLKAYQRLGAKIGDELYWDEEFNTADVFVWLERANLQQRYVRHFVQRKSEETAGSRYRRFAA